MPARPPRPALASAPCFCPQNPQSDKEALQEGRSTTLRYPRSPDGYLQIGEWAQAGRGGERLGSRDKLSALPSPGSFSKGVAEGEVDPAFGPLEALRLSIQTDSPVWVILSEVRPGGAGSGNTELRGPALCPADRAALADLPEEGGLRTSEDWS